jgi:anti-sigma factor RsiW
MSCEKFEEMISVSLDGELTAQETDQLHWHLSTCQACREFLSSMQQIKDLFKLQPDQVLSDEFDQKFFARLTELRSERRKETKAIPWWKVKFVIPAPVAYAVILAFLFLMGLIFYKKAPVEIAPSEQYYSEKQVVEVSQKIRKVKITKDDIIAIYGQKNF